MTSPERVYKVVRRHHGMLVSVFAYPKDGGVIYDIGQTTLPRQKFNPFLWAFESLEFAQEFVELHTNADRYSYFIIFEALATEVRKQAQNLMGEKWNAHSYPSGTVFCSSITLVKQI
jgi:hypothetical protein